MGLKKAIIRMLSMALLLLLLMVNARADVWGYVDERGVPHFAAEKLDDRYELFFRADAPSPFAQSGASQASLVALPIEATDRQATPFPKAIAVPPLPAKLAAFFEISASYKAVRHLMRDASNTFQIDFELLQALIATESGFDAQVVSPKGAVGLMQLMPATAQRFGVVADGKSPIDKKLTDPEINVKAGSRYLRYLINMFPGKLDLALASYNAGEGAVKRAGNAIPNYKETQNYVKTVMQLYTMLKPPAFINAPSHHAPPAAAHLASATLLPTGRVQAELAGPPVPLPPAVPLGGARGRGNMITPLIAPSALPLMTSIPAHD
jgi:hypothetical protein